MQYTGGKMKVNVMGSRVETGFQCKPVKSDKDVNRPIMFYRFHLFMCSAERCDEYKNKISARDLRTLIKELQFNKGENRIKVTENKCFGACRFKSVVLVYSLTDEHFPLWLKKTHRWNASHWKSFLEELVNNPNKIAEYIKDWQIAMQDLEDKLES